MSTSRPDDSLRGQPRATDVNPDENGVIHLAEIKLDQNEIDKYYEKLKSLTKQTQLFFDSFYMPKISSSQKMAVLQETSPQIIASAICINWLSLVTKHEDPRSQKYAHQYYRDLTLSEEECSVSPETAFIYYVLKFPGYRATLTACLNRVKAVVDICFKLSQSIDMPSVNKAEKALFVHKGLRDFLKKDFLVTRSETFEMLDYLEANLPINESVYVNKSSTAAIKMIMPENASVAAATTTPAPILSEPVVQPQLPVDSIQRSAASVVVDGDRGDRKQVDRTAARLG